MTWFAIWKLAKPLLPYIAGLLILAGLLSAYGHRQYERGSHSRDAQVATLAQNIAEREAASVKAAADNLAHVKQVEAEQAAITKEQSNALTHQLTDARSALAAYLVRSKAGQGNASQGDVSSVPGSSGGIAGASENAVVPVADLGICADNTVKAKAWRDWYNEQAAIVR
jgi:hypothetical protein